MAVPIWRGTIRGGKVCLDLRRQFDAYAGSIDDGKRIELVLRREVKHKSNNQRRYFHGVVLDLFAEHLGRSPAELKAILKLKFLWDGETVDRAGLPVVPSTEDLDAKQYARLIDETLRLAAECGCCIPSPDEAEAG